MTENPTLALLVLPGEKALASAVLNACERRELAVLPQHDELLRIEHGKAANPTTLSLPRSAIRRIIDRLPPTRVNESLVNHAVGRSRDENAIVVATFSPEGCKDVVGFRNLVVSGMIRLVSPSTLEDLDPDRMFGLRTVKFLVVDERIKELNGGHALWKSLIGTFCAIENVLADEDLPHPVPRSIVAA